MATVRKGSRKIVIYEHPDGVIFIQPTTKLPNGRHRINQDKKMIAFANSRDSPEVLGKKIKEMLAKCD